ncbi:MATE family efflux transporter [Clostridia bacterium]|nr:MATE family efflux transporter [Clostridia bacterium]
MLFVREKQFYKSYFGLTLVIAAQNLISQGVALTDNIVLGTYNENALSGATIANQVLFLLTMVVFGGGDAIVAICSQYWGKKQIDPIKHIINAALIVSVALGVVTTVVSFAFPTQVLSIFTNKQEVIETGALYLRTVSISYVFFAVTYTLLAAFRSVETIRIGIILTSVSFVLNLILNYALVFGNFGFPEMGVRGAAIATDAARIVEFIIVVTYLFKVDKKLVSKFDEIARPDKELFFHYLKVGYPMLLAGLFWAIGTWAQTAILGRLEDAAVISANAIAVIIMQITSVVVYASSNATAVIVGKTIGESRIKAVKAYAKTFQIIYLILGVITCIVMLLLRDWVLGFYNISNEAREYARQFITALAYISIGIAYHMSAMVGIVRGGGDPKFVLYTDTIFVWLVVIPSSYIAAFVLHMPPIVVFCCLKCDQVLKCFVAFVKVNRYTWIRVMTHGDDTIKEEIQ